MKKSNLFKALGIVILIYILMSWIVPIIYSIADIEGEVAHQIGFVSILSVILEAFSGFGSVVLYVLLVGAFYGVLKVTGAYDKVMEFLSDKSKGREKGILIGIIVLMTIISSISGLDLGLLILYPLLIGLVVKMGYDKMVALSATLGATIVGMYGATFAGTLYGLNNQVLGLDKFDQIVPKIIFFVVGLALLIVFVLLYCKKNNLVFDAKKVVKADAKKDAKVKVKKEKKDKKDKKTVSKDKKKSKEKSEKKEKKEKKVRVKGEKKERTALPGLIILGVLFLIFFLGTTTWEGIFGSNWFAKAHDAWMGVKIGGFEILSKLFGGVDAFGLWNTPLRFQTYSILLVIAMIALATLYRTKPEKCFEGFVDGIKSFVVPAILTVLACSVFVFVYYNPVLTPVTTLLLNATDSFNVALSGIYTIINSVFYVDYYYLAYSVLYSITSIYDDSAVLSIVSVMFANLYSVVMLVAPTSVLMLISLSISEVKYTDWIKFIWKLALTLLIVSFIVFSIMLLV